MSPSDTLRPRSRLDILRPPSRLDQAVDAYKDWLHLNIFDHASGSVGLINVSLHGAPHDPRARAVGTALVHTAGGGWMGNLEIRGMSEARIDLAGIGLAGVGVASDRVTGRVLASASLPDDEFAAELVGTPACHEILIEQRVPLGSGWISWYLVPRLTLEGWIAAGAVRMDLAAASAYHDHNWGRWHWGDDLGWEWGCFMAPAPGPAFVITRVTDRGHRRTSAPTLIVQQGARRSRVSGSSVRLEWGGRFDGPLRRLPGALAALHQDRRRPDLPARLRLRVGDGALELEFEAIAAAQLMTADPVVSGYGFIHEMVGTFSSTGRMGNQELAATGLAVVEWVD